MTTTAADEERPPRVYRLTKGDLPPMVPVAWVECLACQGMSRILLRESPVAPLFEAGAEHVRRSHPGASVPDSLQLILADAISPTEGEPAEWEAYWGEVLPTAF